MSITWKANTSGNWSDSLDWSGHHVPGAGSSVTLTSTTPVTITFDETDRIGTLVSTNDLLDITGGTLAVTATTTLAGGLDETGGTLSLGKGLSTLGGGVTIGTGDIALTTGATVNLAGAVTLGDVSSGYGAHIYGAATMISSGSLIIANAGDVGEATLGDRLVWINTGTVTQNGIINAAYNGGIAFTIINQAGAVYNFTTDIACLMNMQIVNAKGATVTASSDFVNHGVLEKTGDSGATTVYSTVTSTGTIDVLMGTINIEDGGTIGGILEGAGILQFSDGGTLSGAVASISQIDLSGGSLILNDVTIAGTLDGAGGASIVNGASLDVTGGVGSGMIVTMGTGTDLAIGDPAAFLGTITGFAAGDTLDVALSVTSATVDGNGTLTMFDSGAVAGTLLLTPGNAGDQFTLASDQNGGTLLELLGGPGAAPRMGFAAGGNWLGTTLSAGFAPDTPAVVVTPAAAGPELWRDPPAGAISFSGTHAAPGALILHIGH